jgi:hypothetical protein
MCIKAFLFLNQFRFFSGFNCYNIHIRICVYYTAKGGFDYLTFSPSFYAPWGLLFINKNIYIYGLLVLYEIFLSVILLVFDILNLSFLCSLKLSFRHLFKKG